MRWPIPAMVVVLAFLGFGCAAKASTPLTWHSDVTGTELHGEFTASSSKDTQPLAIYFKNLSIPKLGTESDETILADLHSAGLATLVLDYSHHASATGPQLCADVLKLRHDLADSKKKSLLLDEKIDPSRIYILPEGFRLKRDVVFAKNGARTLAMDIIYPAKPASPAPLLMEFTCDNQNRMGSFSLLFCHDALLEGATFSGFASAMADHPVPPPYKGLDDPMPQVIHRIKAAVRTARSQSTELNLSGKIGVIGFSRGGPMAAILASTNGRQDLEGDGEHLDQSSDVSAALVHGNRYDYLDLLPNDPMLARFEKAWGKRDDNKEKWAVHGALFYLRETAAPMFLNTSDAESPEYRDGLKKLADKLTAVNSIHTYQQDPDTRGHRVSTDPKTLAAIYAFFHQHTK